MQHRNWPDVPAEVSGAGSLELRGQDQELAVLAGEVQAGTESDEQPGYEMRGRPVASDALASEERVDEGHEQNWDDLRQIEGERLSRKLYRRAWGA